MHEPSPFRPRCGDGYLRDLHLVDLRLTGCGAGEDAAHRHDGVGHPDHDRHAQQRLRGHALPGLPDLRGPDPVRPLEVGQLGDLAPGPGRELEAVARRQEDLDLHAAQRRKIPRRHRLQRRCGDLEPRAHLQQGQRAVRAPRHRHHARAGADPRLLQEDRRHHRVDDDDQRRLLLPVDGALHAECLARLVGEGGQGLGQGGRGGSRRHRSVQDHQGRAAPVGDARTQ